MCQSDKNGGFCVHKIHETSLVFQLIWDFLQNTENLVNLLESVVVEEAYPGEAPGLCEPHPLGELEGVEVARPRHHAPGHQPLGQLGRAEAGEAETECRGPRGNILKRGHAVNCEAGNITDLG